MRNPIDNPMGKYAQVAKQLESPAVKLDTLARYAQGQNPAVPEFLALAEIKRRQSLNQHSAAPAQTTVQEDLVRAASPQPMMPQGMPQGMPQQMPHQMAGLQSMQRPQGVAALPTGMGEEAYAGGGIVAFDDGGYVNEEMQYAGGGIVAFANGSRDAVDDSEQEDNAYLRRSRGLVEGVKNMVGPIFNPRSYDLPYLYQRDIGQPFERYANKVVEGFKETPEQQAARFRSYSMTPNQTPTVGYARPTTSTIPTTSAQVKKMMPEESNLKPDPLGRYVAGPNDESKLYEAEALAKKISPKGEALPTVGEKGRMASTTSETKPGEDMYAKYEEMFKNQAADSKAARQQDKYMRLLEAGLGIMGGTSQHALTNIGQGSMAAAKGYAQDRADYRKEDRQNIMDLMSLGMKKEDAKRDTEKLAIMRKEAEDKGIYYGSYADFLKSKGANLGNASETAMDKANLAAIGKMHAGLLKEAGKMGSPYYGKSAEELWQLAQGLVLKGGSGAPAPTTVQWGSLGVPTKS
jgi:hypothetical protein